MAEILAPDSLRPDHRRRSKRLKIRIPVVVRSQEKRTQAESTHTLMINAHGTLLLLAMPVSVDKFVVLENPSTGKEILCRITHLGMQFMGKTQVGLEFIKPAPDFWGLDNRPDDWDPQHAASRAQARTKKLTPVPTVPATK
jgi:hypothetical protein